MRYCDAGNVLDFGAVARAALVTAMMPVTAAALVTPVAKMIDVEIAQETTGISIFLLSKAAQGR
jgi:hypothetical protein